jgi:hypothetical protein
VADYIGYHLIVKLPFPRSLVEIEHAFYNQLVLNPILSLGETEITTRVMGEVKLRL